MERYTTRLSTRILLSKSLHLVLPVHKAIEAYEEKRRGLDKIGSTLRGIGPCYADKYARRGIRLQDSLHNHIRDLYTRVCEWHAKVRVKAADTEAFFYRIRETSVLSVD